MDSYTRRLRNIRVIDGDTIEAEVDLGFGVILGGGGRKKKIRFEGIDAYETTRRGTWDQHLSEDEILVSIERGKEGKRLVEDLTAKGRVYLKSTAWSDGKYGRLLGVVLIEKEGVITNVNDTLVALGLAVRKDY